MDFQIGQVTKLSVHFTDIDNDIVHVNTSSFVVTVHVRRNCHGIYLALEHIPLVVNRVDHRHKYSLVQ